jgi:Leucine-rich repeat (LRR) protein
MTTNHPENVEELSLNVESLASCSFLRQFTNVKQLQINVNKLRNLEGLQSMSAMEELSAKDNAISDITAVRGSTSMKIMKLDDNHLTADGLESGLSGLVNLQSLTVSSNKLAHLPTLERCPRLQRLEAYHNSIVSVSVQALAALKSLLHLDLGEYEIVD